MSVAALQERIVTDDFLIESEGLLYAGNHLLIDLYGAKHLDNVSYMEAAFRRAVEAAGATLLHLHVHHFGPGCGVSGVAVLSESHMSVHTWPERGYAAFDVFMCGKAEPEKAISVFEAMFEPQKLVLRKEMRGDQIQENTDDF